MKNEELSRHGRGDPCGRPPRGHARRTCQEDMCCGDSRLVSPQATLFSEISSCRNHHILLSSRCFSTGFFFDRLFFLINMVACGDTGRAKLATHVLLACPSGGRPQGSPLHATTNGRQTFFIDFVDFLLLSLTRKILHSSFFILHSSSIRFLPPAVCFFDGIVYFCSVNR